MDTWINLSEEIKCAFPNKEKYLSEKEIRKIMISKLENSKKSVQLMEDALYNSLADTSESIQDMEKFVGPIEAIAEVERLAPEHYQHVKDILESMGFVQSVPLNDKWMIHLKRVVVPSWNLVDIDTLRPIQAKNVTIEFAIKVHLPDLFLKGDEWRVISNNTWHEAKFTDHEEEPFEIYI